MGTPNCYDCKFRRNLPGDSHSVCVHPVTKTVDGSTDMFLGMVRLLSGDLSPMIKTLEISANPHGVRCGWFMWPFNYDPAWLTSCNGFEPKDT